MPAVFVHGVPDTVLVWRPLLERLSRRDTICLALPGFGNKRARRLHPGQGQLRRLDRRRIEEDQRPY